jgi:hypothetical protein
VNSFDDVHWAELLAAFNLDVDLDWIDNGIRSLAWRPTDGD